MNASTSKNGKLYAFLKGYETCAFTGSDLSKVTEATRQLLHDEFRVNFPELDASEIDKNVYPHIEKFLVRYYDRMRNMRDPSKVKDLAEKSKKDLKDLESLISKLMSTDCSLEAAAYWVKPSAEPTDLCQSCPWYVADKFCMLFVDSSLQEGMDYQIFKFQIPEYKYLALGIIRMAHVLLTYASINYNEFISHYTLFTNILSVAHIFELMNPTGESREEYLQAARDLITADHVDYDTEQYHKYDNLLSEVLDDIKKGRKKYIQDFSNAWRKTKYFLHESFDVDRDYYYSMKGTGQIKYTGEKYSLQSSAFEIDPHKDDPRVSAFDNFIGYHSYYKEDPQGPDFVSIRTIGINNPAKFKIRIIHILDNALQDRCNWIHRRLMSMLKRMDSDSTHYQERGRQFLKNLTADWYLSSPSERIGIYCTDFSNATDTADQRFTHRVLEFLFESTEIADFWDYMSTCLKELEHADRSKELYRQTSGQPQGALASFPIFAICHHILFLMDMKENGLEDVKASDFYTVLGDDAIYNSVYPESRFVDPDEPIYDSENIQRSELEISHFDKCSKFAGFKINYDKSESAHQWSSEAKLDFAKVTYRNGKLFSPIPFRLAMKYNRSFDDKLAVVIWRADRKDENALSHLSVILESLPESVREDYRYLIQSGELPFLDELRDFQDRPEDWVNRVRYSLALNLLKSGLAFTLMKDHERSGTSNFDQFNAAMDTIFTKGQSLRLDKIHPDHKVMRLLEKNGEILQVLHDILRQEDFDDIFLSMCVSSLAGDTPEEIEWLVYEIARFQRLLFKAKNNPDIGVEELRQNFPVVSSLRDIRQDITNLSNRFMTRGITKRPGEMSQLFRGVFNTLDDLNQQLDKSFGELPNTNINAQLSSVPNVSKGA